MAVKITQTAVRSLPPMLGEPVHEIRMRRASTMLLHLLRAEHPEIVRSLVAKNGMGRNDPDAEENEHA